MVLNYIKLSIRLLLRNPFFTFINVLGLCVAFATFFLLWQYSQYELKSDQQWNDHDKIARLGIFWSWTDDNKNWDSELYGTTVPSFAPVLVTDFPELESYTRIIHRSSFNQSLTGLDKDVIVSFELPGNNEIKILEDKVVMADANLFSFFGIPILYGDDSQVIAEANTAAMSATLAQKYFGDEDPRGKMITINKQLYSVTGVFKDLSHNTHLDFQLVLSNRAKVEHWATWLGAPCVSSYVKARSTVDWVAFESKLNAPDMIAKYYGVAMRIFKSKASSLVQPLSEVSFSQKWRGDQFNPKSKILLYIFQSVGIMVLVLAFVNYICLSTLRINDRQKEVATRKVSGASFSDLIRQFTVETTIIFAISIALSFTLLQLMKYPLNTLLQIPVYQIDGNAAVAVLSVIVVMIALSAAYPAYLSGTKVRDLFNKNKTKSRLGFHIPLTSLQLSIAVVLIILGFMTYYQVNFLLTNDLGFNKDHVLVVNGPTFKTDNPESDFEVFKNRVRSIKSIHDATVTNTVMGDNIPGFAAKRPGPQSNSVALDSNGGVDENFIPFFGLQLVAGRNFNTSDVNSLIVSEGALYRLGFDAAENAVGASLDVVPVQNGGENHWVKATIIGVIRGYRMRPMLRFTGDHDARSDAGIGLSYRQHMIPFLKAERLILKVAPVDVENTLRGIEKVYSEIFPGNVFHSYFLDEHINRHYQNERVWRNQILFFTSLAIVIACLGMFGMISNKASEKTKEIGIRKVLGAQIHQIAQLLLSTTAKQAALATMIGVPVAYNLTQEYLEKFSEKIQLSWWHYALPILMLMMIILTTIAGVLIKAANANPIDALRSE